MFTAAGWVALASWSSVLGGCATTPSRLAPIVVVTAAAPPVTISTRGPIAARDGARIARAIPAALTRLQRWGLAWQHPVDVEIHSEPATFIRSTGQTVPSLRAWSTWRRVDVLATDTWARATDLDVEQRLTHELCHLALWHRATNEARARTLPRFAAEGICSVVAEQGPLRLDAHSVVVALDAGRTIDFVDDSPFAYAVAHHAVAGLTLCSGPGAVTALLDAMYRGVDVAAALGRPLRELVEVAATQTCR